MRKLIRTALWFVFFAGLSFTLGAGCGKIQKDKEDAAKLCAYVCAPKFGRMVENECLCRADFGWIFPSMKDKNLEDFKSGR